jgi:hypothetical protein
MTEMMPLEIAMKVGEASFSLILNERLTVFPQKQ